jgi:hypothetical protein
VNVGVDRGVRAPRESVAQPCARHPASGHLRRCSIGATRKSMAGQFGPPHGARCPASWTAGRWRSRHWQRRPSASW